MRRFVHCLVPAVVILAIGLSHGLAYSEDTLVSGTIPLVAKNVNVSGVTAAGATVSWSTNGESTSQVFYDIVPHPGVEDYAGRSALDPAPVTSHAVTLSGLDDALTYHFRVESMAGNLTALSDDAVFTTLSPSSGGGGGISGGVGGGATGPGITNLLPYLGSTGVFNIPVTAASDDRTVRVIIDRGVQGLTADGSMLKSMSIRPVTDVPTPPADTAVIGLVYELGPDGAKFTPAVTLTFSYDPAIVPAGVDERNLVLATWDAAAGKWVDLDSTVDTSAHVITVSITHFIRYAVFAHVAPASFSLSALTISPELAKTGETITVSTRVTNSGDLSSGYVLSLKINGETVATSNVTVAGGGTQTVTLTTVQNTPGKYEVDVNGLAGGFTVESAIVDPLLGATFKVSDLAIMPSEVDVGESVTVSVLVINIGLQSGTYTAILEINDAVAGTEDVVVAAGASQTVAFTAVEGAPGAYTVEVGGMAGSFEVSPAEAPPARAINRWLVGGGAVAAIAVVAAVLSLLVRRRKM